MSQLWAPGRTLEFSRGRQSILPVDAWITTTPTLLRREGRSAFGSDPRGYLRYRIPYPPRVFEILESSCGLKAGARVFEVGPGPGVASRELLRRGADPLYAIEPDPRLARYLGGTLTPRRRVRVVRATFEDAALPEGSFDLGVAATSFHWVHGRVGLPKVARLLRPGGWWAMWWNRHGDPDRRGQFFHAIQPLYSPRPAVQARWIRQDRSGERRERPVVSHSWERVGTSTASRTSYCVGLSP